MQTGDYMPQFSLKDHDDNVFSSEEKLRGKVAVIFFYPKDDSPVCTIEACSFRDSFADFAGAGAEVIGINAGSPASHKKFREKYELPFTLLSDPGNVVLQAFGVKNFLFLKGRETFVVDRKGVIIHKFRSMLRGAEHVSEALRIISRLNAD